MKGNQITFLFALSLVLAGCTGTSTSVAVEPVPTPDGDSRELPNLNRAALGNLDQVGTNTQAWTATTFVVPARDLPIRGWAVDGNARALAGGVDVVVDRNAYRAQYGLDRPDVARANNVPTYGKSGFSFVLPGGRFPKGKHTVSIRVISADKRSYAEMPPITFDIE
jgi:hypothetical protein